MVFNDLGINGLPHPVHPYRSHSPENSPGSAPAPSFLPRQESSLRALLRFAPVFILIGVGGNRHERLSYDKTKIQGISFESVISAIKQGGLVDVPEHPNQDRYQGQLIYVVEVEEYLRLVPFVIERDGVRFLKTIIPSRKAMRDYRRRRPS